MLHAGRSLVLTSWLSIAAGGCGSEGSGRVEAVPLPPGTGPSELLYLPGVGADTSRIDFAALPTISGEHAVVSPQDPVLTFQLHSYLIHSHGQYWCMWSQGPPVEDEPGQRIRYSVSSDGINWSAPRELTGPPRDGYGYIARGFWLRDGELLALVASYKGKGAFGTDKDLKLQAFAWDASTGAWAFRTDVFVNAINNFPPQRLPSREWMMSRRDARFNVYMLIGGELAVDQWQSVPVVGWFQLPDFRPDEPIWWPNADASLVALFRDNAGSDRIWTARSTDMGRTWSVPARTNFPNSPSKLFSMALASGCRILVSNANPAVGRRDMHLSMSRDGRVFTAMFALPIPSSRASTYQYPHALEHEGHLFIVFSRTKAAIEILKIPLDRLPACEAVG